MRLSTRSIIVVILAGLGSSAWAEEPTNPTQGNMSGGASEWLAQSGSTPIVTLQAEAQSPFTDVYAKNDVGLHLPATAGKDVVVFARGMNVTGPMALLSMDVQLPSTGSGEGYYLNFLGTGRGYKLRLGNKLCRSGANRNILEE